MTTHTLPRSGGAPLRFEGDKLGEQTTRVSSGFRNNRWHELTLYRKADGRLVLAIAYRTCWQGEEPRDDVLLADDADELDSLVREYAGVLAGRHVTVPPGDVEKKQRLHADLQSGFERAVGDLLAAGDVVVETDPFTQQQLAAAHEEFVRLALADLKLSRGEACAVCDANNGCFVSDGGWQHLWANVADAGRLEALGEKWDVDVEALAGKIRAADLGAQYALAVAVKRFWDRCRDDTDVVLQEIGLVAKQ